MRASEPAVWPPVSTAPTVLCVDDDPDYLALAESCLGEKTDFDLRTETDPRAALDSLAGVDCVVTDYRMPGMDGLELLAAVRERRPSLPVVLCSGSSVEDLLPAVTEYDRTELVCKDRTDLTATLVAERVRRLVAERRRSQLVSRALAALDATGDGVAVVDPEGRFALVDDAFARRFGHDPDDLAGRDWRTCYPEDEAHRLASTALPSVREEWRWTGRCVGLRADGETFRARTSFVGLDGGPDDDGDRRDPVGGFVIVVAPDDD